MITTSDSSEQGKLSVKELYSRSPVTKKIYKSEAFLQQFLLLFSTWPWVILYTDSVLLLESSNSNGQSNQVSHPHSKRRVSDDHAKNPVEMATHKPAYTSFYSHSITGLCL